PANRLGVQRLTSRADAAELLWIAPPRVRDRHHRAHRGRRREHVRHVVTAQEVELPVRVEPRLAPVDALHRPKTPRAKQPRDPGRPGPFAHAVEAFALLDLVA